MKLAEVQVTCNVVSTEVGALESRTRDNVDRLTSEKSTLSMRWNKRNGRCVIYGRRSERLLDEGMCRIGPERKRCGDVKMYKTSWTAFTQNVYNRRPEQHRINCKLAVLLGVIRVYNSASMWLMVILFNALYWRYTVLEYTIRCIGVVHGQTPQSAILVIVQSCCAKNGWALRDNWDLRHFLFGTSS